MIPAVALFGTLWGASELFLGGWLYAADVPYASVPLTLIALCVLSVARAHVPRAGSSVAIALLAAAYKAAAMLSAAVLGTLPVFACHLLGIVLLGATYEAAFALLGRRSRIICGAIVPPVSNALFAFGMTFVIRYRFWVEGGWEKIGRHVGVSGLICAAAGAILVPLCFALVEAARRRKVPLPLRSWLAAGGAFATASLWVAAILAGG
jgi:hypothetical protein